MQKAPTGSVCYVLEVPSQGHISGRLRSSVVIYVDVRCITVWLFQLADPLGIDDRFRIQPSSHFSRDFESTNFVCQNTDIYMLESRESLLTVITINSVVNGS